MSKESKTPTPWAVHCHGHMEGHECNKGAAIFLTEEEYTRQMMNPDALWKCPSCGCSASWDDDIYEKALS